MNIKEITTICLTPNLGEDEKRHYILTSICKDSEALPDILKILVRERELNTELLLEMNNELSRADAFIESWIPPNPVLKKGTKESGITKSFVLEKIAEFYERFKERIAHNYKGTTKQKQGE